MSAPLVVRVSADRFDLSHEIDALKRASGSTDIGAIATFSGVCRSDGGKLSALELEHYPGMAEAELARIAAIAAKRWPILGLTLIHRYGKIPVGDDIVLVITVSPHRQAAFDAASFLMDYLKTNAPFWKKEHYINGRSGDWIRAKTSDDEAALKWSAKPE